MRRCNAIKQEIVTSSHEEAFLFLVSVPDAGVLAVFSLGLAFFHVDPLPCRGHYNQEHFPGVQSYQSEVSDPAAIASHYQRVTHDFPDLNVLINNAGVYTDSHAGTFDNIEYEAWVRAFLVNTMAPLKMAQAFASNIARGSQKTIVTISSKMGSITDNTGGGSYMYRSSKAAVNMVVKTLAIDLKRSGVIAVVFHPGWVKTDMGGPKALISVNQSVSGMRQVISRLMMADSGKFFAYDGKLVPW